jgi:hypothetical protein
MDIVYFDFPAETTNIFGASGSRNAASLTRIRMQQGSIQHDGEAVEREPAGIPASAGANTSLAIRPAFDSFQ